MRISKLIKKDVVILVSIIFIFSILFFFTAYKVNSQWAQDSHWHMSLVENMASGKGYTTDGMFPHGKYPPGLSFLILPFYLLFQDINLAGLTFIYLCSILSIILLYIFAKEILNRKIAIIAVIFLAFHNLFIFNSVSIMTETPFMLFSIACIYFFIKSFDKPIFILPSLISFSIATLIRYDGLFLIFPLLSYTYNRIFDLRKLISSKVFIWSLALSSALILVWVLRNFIVFGSFIYSDYTRELTSFSIGQFLSFSLLFFKLGYLFPILALIGIGFALFKLRKDAKVLTLLIWLLSYIVLHSIWSARAFRFYGEILLLICLFAALGLSRLIELMKDKKKLVISLVVILVILEQLFIFYTGSINYETTQVTLNRYESIHQLSSWANDNLPNDSIYAVTDVAVYSIYLKKYQIVYFNQGLDSLIKNNGTIYFLTDTLHPWATSSILKGLENNELSFQVTDSQNKLHTIYLTPEIVKEIEYMNKSKAILFRITNVSIN